MYQLFGTSKPEHSGTSCTLSNCASWEHKLCTVRIHTLYHLSTAFNSSQLVPCAGLQTRGLPVFYLPHDMTADCALILMSILYNTVQTHWGFANFVVLLKKKIYYLGCFLAWSCLNPDWGWFYCVTFFGWCGPMTGSPGRLSLKPEKEITWWNKMMGRGHVLLIVVV